MNVWLYGGPGETVVGKRRADEPGPSFVNTVAAERAGCLLAGSLGTAFRVEEAIAVPTPAARIGLEAGRPAPPAVARRIEDPWNESS